MTETSLLSGLTVPLVTPLLDDDRIDTDAASAHLRSLAERGVTRVMLLGSNGEGAAIAETSSRAFARDATAEWRRLTGGGQVLVTVFADSTAGMLRAAAGFRDAEPDALVLPPPHYFTYSDDELLNYYRSASALDSPVVAYNIPRYTGNPLRASMLPALAEMAHVVGMKDSSGDEDGLRVAIALRSEADFEVSQGDEAHLAEALLAGAVGITPGIANIAPTVCLDLLEATGRDDRAAVEASQSLVRRVRAIHSVRPGVPMMKAAVSLLGFGTGHVTGPFRAPTELEHAALQQTIDGLGDLVIRNDRPPSSGRKGPENRRLSGSL
jgi:4-hydroxy-tetrahydrodipicolinate synthase